MGRPSYDEALERAGVLRTLARFDPHVAGTPPLGLDLPASDIDILCHAPDPYVFTSVLWAAFSGLDDFAVRQWVGAERPVIASFAAEGWVFEVFGHARPVSEQHGWRHFLIEQRLLAFGGPRLRAAVMARRRAGAKTEPAFAAALDLPGNPYQALLDIERWPDEAVAALIAGAGFRAAGQPLQPTAS
jgi:hypothetical protein